MIITTISELKQQIQAQIILNLQYHIKYLNEIDLITGKNPYAMSGCGICNVITLTFDSINFETAIDANDWAKLCCDNKTLIEKINEFIIKHNYDEDDNQTAWLNLNNNMVTINWNS